MTVFKLVGVAVTATAAALVLRTLKPEIAGQVSIAAGVLVLVYAVTELLPVLGFVKELSERFSLDARYIGITLKVIGVAYLVQFAASICRDAGESAVAGKIELAGRAIIMTLCLPMVIAVLDTVTALIPNG